MKLCYVEISGFRGYRDLLRIDFGEHFTIIDGRNGAGKSTIFDAVEFALTGTLGKYRVTKVAGETIDDYIWWLGSGAQPADRYVEVGFAGKDGLVKLRRSQFLEPDPASLEQIVAHLCDSMLAPSSPLKQLCTSTIIRDEHIAELSLDLKETERYALIHDALGASDADLWITRAQKLLGLAKRRTDAAQLEVTNANSEVAAAASRIDEVRAQLVTEDVLTASIERLRAFAGYSQVPPDDLAGPVRIGIAEVEERLETAINLLEKWETTIEHRATIARLLDDVKDAQAWVAAAERTLVEIPVAPKSASASELARRAHDLVALISAGQQIGLQDDACPLCATKQTHDQFEHGIQLTRSLAAEMDKEAARQSELEAAHEEAILNRNKAVADLDRVTRLYDLAYSTIKQYATDLEKLQLSADTSKEQLIVYQQSLRNSLERAQHDLKILGTLQLNTHLERLQHDETAKRRNLVSAQEKFSSARRAEAAAQSIYDGARRAAAENLDHRLERVLPLLTELYKRLRPHPIWRNIEYSIRGDVKRFLSLKVGDSLNPQFLFSSGQRRATGLAFLLSVNASMAWSKWRSILLDDPVQHVDDFRAVHLAEVLAQLVAEDRQIICAVEDAALADLFCRRLPIGQPGVAKRVTLGPAPNGSPTKVSERSLSPHPRRAMISLSGETATG